jgi:hypothetical protein
MAMAAGAVFRIAGGITGGIAADQRRKRYEEMMASLPKPDPRKESQGWFDDMDHFYRPANRLSERARNDELTQNLALRERALPGFGAMVGDASRSIAPLLRGELPAGVMSAFQRAGGAGTNALGFGGSQFGALNTGLFGARGALGAISTGMGLLPSLLSTMPNVSAPTTMGLLSNLMTPQQRINLQMQLRQQQIGMTNTLESMPTALDSWSAHLNESGAMLMGGGMGGMGGGMGGGGGGGRAPSAPSGGGLYNVDYTLGSPSNAAQSYNFNGAVGQAAGRLY